MQWESKYLGQNQKSSFTFATNSPSQVFFAVTIANSSIYFPTCLPVSFQCHKCVQVHMHGCMVCINGVKMYILIHDLFFEVTIKTFPCEYMQLYPTTLITAYDSECKYINLFNYSAIGTHLDYLKNKKLEDPMIKIVSILIYNVCITK